jgi:hypothetical protein
MMPLPGPGSVLTVVGIYDFIASPIILAESNGIQYRLKLLHAEPVQPQSVPTRNQEPSSRQENRLQILQMDKCLRLADQVTRLQILQINKCLSIAHENYLLLTGAKEQFADDKQADIEKWEQGYQQWIHIWRSTNGFDLKQFPQKVKEAVENQYLSMQWDAPAFKYHDPCSRTGWKHFRSAKQPQSFPKTNKEPPSTESEAADHTAKCSRLK